jgi:hypothetical protein
MFTFILGIIIGAAFAPFFMKLYELIKARVTASKLGDELFKKPEE